MTNQDSKQPTCLLVIGMAGSGKSTLMGRLASEIRVRSTATLEGKVRPPYVVNLDPAVAKVPYDANIDIRDTVDYRRVMKEYGLGPNGAIMTALNLFTTKFDQVLSLIDKRSTETDFVLIDTPGQIEIFTWSASGAIISETMATLYPTVVVYVVDTPRTVSPATFMANMLYACSILYKTKLPFILAFNKCDVVPHQFALDWMQDFEVFQEALAGDTSYMSSLVNSMSLMLEEFYRHLKVVGVSAMTGQGMGEFFSSVDECVQDYYTHYRPEVDAKILAKESEANQLKEEQLQRLMKDMKVADKGHIVLDGNDAPERAVPLEPKQNVVDSDDEEDNEEDEEDEFVDVARERAHDQSLLRFLNRAA